MKGGMFVNLKRKFLIAASSFIVATSILSNVAFAGPADAVGGSTTVQDIVASDGLFTFYDRADSTCNDTGTFDQLVDPSTLGLPKASSSSSDGGIIDTIKNLPMQMMTDQFTMILNGISGLFDLKCGQSGALGLVSQLFVLMKTVNVTYLQGVMQIVTIAQWFALSLTLLMMIYYGITMSAGIQQTPPMMFALRMFFAILGIYVAPYLVQDILNINNYLVHNLSQLHIVVNSAGKAGPTVQYAFPAAIMTIFASFVKWNVYGMFIILIAIVTIIFCLIPLFKLILWWYVRWFKIMIYTVISPFMLMAVGLQETSKTTSRWFGSLMRETFAQSIVVFGIMAVSSLIPTLGQIIQTYKIGALGAGLVLYAMLSFLAQLPELAHSLFQGDVSRYGLKELGGWIENFAGNVRKQIPKSIRDPIAPKKQNRKPNILVKSGSGKTKSTGSTGTGSRTRTSGRKRP